MVIKIQVQSVGYWHLKQPCYQWYREKCCL